jgi:hypothetical protein
VHNSGPHVVVATRSVAMLMAMLMAVSMIVMSVMVVAATRQKPC